MLFFLNASHAGCPQYFETQYFETRSNTAFSGHTGRTYSTPALSALCKGNNR
jgi:hypothetical protein